MKSLISKTQNYLKCHLVYSAVISFAWKTCWNGDFWTILWKILNHYIRGVAQEYSFSTSILDHHWRKVVYASLFSKVYSPPYSMFTSAWSIATFFHQLSTMSQFPLRIFCLYISHWVYYTNHKGSKIAIKFLVNPPHVLKTHTHIGWKIETSLIKSMYMNFQTRYTLLGPYSPNTLHIQIFIHLCFKTNFPLF